MHCRPGHISLFICLKLSLGWLSSRPPPQVLIGTLHLGWVRSSGSWTPMLGPLHDSPAFPQHSVCLNHPPTLNFLLLLSCYKGCEKCSWERLPLLLMLHFRLHASHTRVFTVITQYAAPPLFPGSHCSIFSRANLGRRGALQKLPQVRVYPRRSVGDARTKSPETFTTQRRCEAGKLWGGRSTNR